MSGFYSTRFRDGYRLRGFSSNLPLYLDPAADPYWANVVALLHCDGADGSTTFTDATGRAWSANGNVQVDTAQSKFGGGSALFDGAGDYLSSAASADFAPGTGDFTYELWLYRAITPTQEMLLCLRQFGVLNGNMLSLQNGYPAFSNGTSWLTSSIIAPLGEWSHIAASRVSGTLRIFVNGAMGYEGSDATNYGGAGRVGRIGITDDGLVPFTGWIDDVRITKGVGRYAGEFSPRTTAFPDS